MLVFHLRLDIIIFLGHLEEGSDRSDGWREEATIDWRLAAYLGLNLLVIIKPRIVFPICRSKVCKDISAEGAWCVHGAWLVRMLVGGGSRLRRHERKFNRVKLSS